MTSNQRDISSLSSLQRIAYQRTSNNGVLEKMKVFETPDFADDTVTKFFEGRTHTSGVFKRTPLERLESVRTTHRPFRRVLFKLEGVTGSEVKTSTSFVDEQLSSQIKDDDHRFLLWRPLYASLKLLDASEKEVSESVIDKSNYTQEVVNTLLLHRWNSQELDDEIAPKLRSLQADPLVSVAFIIPRSPYGLKHEQRILSKRAEVHSFVLASSLIANCAPKDIIVSGEVCEQVFAKTIIAEYRNVSNGNPRILILETPGSNSLREALRSGQALTRICELYPDFIELIG
jgi:hypothetical protein